MHRGLGRRSLWGGWSCPKAPGLAGQKPSWPHLGWWSSGWGHREQGLALRGRSRGLLAACVHFGLY